MRGPLYCTIFLISFKFCVLAPILPPNYILVPTSYVQLRGPFSFLGDWIQNSDWFPLEVNIPDTFAAIGGNIQNFGNGIGGFFQNFGNFAQGVTSNFNGFTQNLGNGWNSFTQNFGNRLQNVTRWPIATKFGTKYYVIVPETQNVKNQKPDMDFDPFEAQLLGSFP